MDREKRLEGVIFELEDDIKRAEFVDNFYVDCVSVQALHEAVTLLKAQVPRVLTLEEACVQDVCWLEWRKRGRKPVACRVIMRKDYAGQPLPCVYRFFEEPTGYSKKNYGKDWRCWTQRPTDEQRRATPWKN